MKPGSYSEPISHYNVLVHDRADVRPAEDGARRERTCHIRYLGVAAPRPACRFRGVATRRLPRRPTTAVVTGASSGIGADIARELARRGHGVTLVARREDRLRDLAAELGETVRVEVIACDVADPDARAGLFDDVADRGLTVDILVNNAGIGTMGSVTKTPVADEIAQVRVNVEAVIDLTTRAVQQMVPRGRGAILNVGSTAGFHPFPGQAGYAATKAFVQQLHRRPARGAGRTPASPSRRCARARCAPSSCKRRAWTRRSSPRRSRSSCGCRRATWRRIGVDALENDRGTVIAGLPSRLSTRCLQCMPRRLLLPTAGQAASGPAPRPPLSRLSRPAPHPALDGQRQPVAQRADRAVPADGDEQFHPLLVVEVARRARVHVFSDHDPVRSSSSTASISTRSAAVQRGSSAPPVTNASHSASLTPAIGPQNAACPPHSYSQRTSAQMRRMAIGPRPRAAAAPRRTAPRPACAAGRPGRDGAAGTAPAAAVRRCDRDGPSC